MSHCANDYVKKLFRDRVTRRQKLLLWSLADYHNSSRRESWPALRTLAEESLMDIRECRRVLIELEEAGLIQRIKGGDGAGDFNKYRLIELDGKDGHMTPLESGTQNSNKDGRKDGRKGGQKDGRKDGHSDRAIRNEREPEPEREQNLKTITPDGAMKSFLEVKAELQKQLPAEEFNLWLRPMYYFKEMSGGVVLLTLPPNTKVVEAARANRDLLIGRLQAKGLQGFALTAYPDDSVLNTLMSGQDGWGVAATRIREKRAKAFCDRVEGRA